MLTWYTATGYGALGGLVVELIAVWQQLRGWQDSRRNAIADGVSPPGLIGRFIDPIADGSVAVTRVLLGCGAGFIFHTELTGVYAAIAVGASAPALLAQLGRAVTEAPPVPVLGGTANAQPEAGV